MKFRSVDSREEAERLNRAEIWVDRALACPKKKGEYYYADLVGCSVTLEGIKIGEVVSIVERSAGFLLAIRTPTGTEKLAPFQDSFFGDVDTDRKTIQLLNAGVLE